MPRPWVGAAAPNADGGPSHGGRRRSAGRRLRMRRRREMAERSSSARRQAMDGGAGGARLLDAVVLHGKRRVDASPEVEQQQDVGWRCSSRRMAAAVHIVRCSDV